MASTKKLICFLSLLVTLISCKERNELYPPPPWANYFYETDAVTHRPISAFLIENEHSEWLGGLGNEGILMNDGYHWNELNPSISFDSVTAIQRDGNSNIWVAWRYGLACYDGVTWKSFPEFQGKRVTSLVVQGLGIIWAGVDDNSDTGGIARIQDGIVNFFTPQNSGIQSSRITALSIDPDQRLWIGTAEKGIILYEEGEFLNFSLESLGLVDSRISCLFSDPSNSTWAGTSTSHLIRFEGTEHVTLNTGTGKPVSSIAIDKEGTAWIGTAGSGVLTLKGANWNSYTVANAHLPSDHVLRLGLHPDGRTLVSFDDGHLIYFKK